MSIVIEKNRIEEKLLSLASPGTGNSFADSIKFKAREYFLISGIPTVKNEEYKYIAFDRIFKNELKEITAASPAGISENLLHKFSFLADAHVVVLVNGFFSKEKSQIAGLPSGLEIVSMKEMMHEKSGIIEKYLSGKNSISDSFSALNTALFSDGVFVRVKKNSVIDKPIVFLSVVKAGQAQIINPRNLVIAETGSKAQFLELFVSENNDVNNFTNSFTEVVVEENASLDHYRIQQEGKNNYQVNTAWTYQHKNSLYNNYTFTINGALVRNNLNVVLQGTNCESHLFGLFIPLENELVDNHTLVDHQKPNCQSNELYKGIISGKATGVFNGKIYVRQDAQKTNAYQSSKNILLSDDATINTKPQLEIYADDVKCSHGTSTGKVDEEALFYLRSRGVGNDIARKLLLNAFAGDVIRQVKWDALREYIEKTITDRLSV